MSDRIVFAGTHFDEPYLRELKGLAGTATISPILESFLTLSELSIPCKKRGISKVISTSQQLLTKLVEKQSASTVYTGNKKPSIDNYAGSYFLHDGIEYVFIDPLKQLVTVPYARHVTARYISKLTAPQDWQQLPAFNWQLLTHTNIQSTYDEFQGAYVIACDIETIKDPMQITCIGYTALFLHADGSMSCKSAVLPINDMFDVAWMRKFNTLPAAKIFQNGKYDISYLSRYNAAPYNYLWDTANLFHSWYSEMPKTLAFLQAYCVRDAFYWKDLANTSDKMQYYLYNAKDTWATLCVWITCMMQMPQWAKNNYLNEFPLVFPCHLAEMTGIKRDMQELSVAEAEQKAKLQTESASLNRMLGIAAPASFNTNSPVQMKALLKVLGCGEVESADEKELKKASLRHPLNARILRKVISIRKTRKLISTYLQKGKEFNGRILYSLNPHGTDTSRLASSEHHFWCGLQIQNIPRGDSVKRTLVADGGFRIAEADLEQAESRDTAHIAGDENLIAAVSSGKDFHSVNASAFFGVRYDSIYSDELGKVLDKPLRDLAKRVNHGANYNMGENVLIDTMGEDKVQEAQSLLKLPKLYSLKQVAAYLLQQFHRTYPKIAGTYYPGVVSEILTTHMLSSKATHHCKYVASPVGLVRYCFGRPDKSKQALNAYVAHPPQSLNAMTLNKAFMTVFYELALHPIHSKNFKLCAQIHDSILFQFREGHEYLCQEVKQRMEIPVTVTGYDGVTRTFTVPAAVKAGKDNKGSLRWSETE